MKSLKYIGNALLDIFEIIFIGTAVFFASYVFVGQLLEVSGSSMYPNFIDKEELIAEKVSVRLKPLKRGEIVIFHHPKEPSKLIIKRVVGLPGETLKISNGYVYIDGNKLDEPYLKNNVVTKEDEYLKENMDYKIPENAYIVMGDNREESTDSRNWGPLYKNFLLGRGFLVYYPLDKIRFIK